MRAALHGLLYRAALRVRRDRRLAILETLRATEGEEPGRIRAAQADRLRTLLLHAFEHVPFYRAPLLEAGVVVPGKVPRVDLTRFAAMPILERASIRDHRDALQDREPAAPDNPRFERGTGGTTGTRLQLVQDRVTVEHAGAVTLWFDEWSGHRPGEPRVALWDVGPRSRRKQVRDGLSSLVRNETVLRINLMSDATLDRYVGVIARRRPALLLGYAGAVHLLARRIQATGIRVPAPRVVMVSAEPLAEGMREVIEGAFRAPVVNRYGALETGGIACECLCRRGLHVAMPTHYVEVVRPDGTPCQPGEDGDVVVTFLANRSMPLIRYRIGDRAVPADPLEPCPCGRPFPRLMNVVGRALDAFLRADGTWVHGVNVKRFNRWTPWIAQFQVVQLTVDHVLVRLVDRERLVDPVTSRRAGLEAIAAYLRELMGPACRVSFEFLDHIPRAPSGKYRLTMRLGPAACQAEPAATSTGGSGTPRSSGSGTVGAHGI